MAFRERPDATASPSYRRVAFELRLLQLALVATALVAALDLVQRAAVGLGVQGIDHAEHGPAAATHDLEAVILTAPILVFMVWWTGSVILAWNRHVADAAKQVRLAAILLATYGFYSMAVSVAFIGLGGMADATWSERVLEALRTASGAILLATSLFMLIHLRKARTPEAS